MRRLTIVIPLALLAVVSAGADARAGEIAGVVVETMETSSYTYVRLEAEGETIWAAAPRTPVAVGDRVLLPSAVPMHDFFSPTFDRTFEVLYMAPMLHVPKPGRQAGDRAVAKSSVAVERVPEAVTVAEMWTRRNELAGRIVTLSAVVVKKTDGVMGRNWIHLRDGTADAEGHDEVTSTTREILEVGDTLTLRGKLFVDRDFGYGYVYPVLIEADGVVVE